MIGGKRRRLEIALLFFMLVNVAVLLLLMKYSARLRHLPDELSLFWIHRQILDGIIDRNLMKMETDRWKSASLDEIGDNPVALEKACLVTIYKVYYDSPRAEERARLLAFARQAFERYRTVRGYWKHDLEAGLCFLEKRYPEAIDAAGIHMRMVRETVPEKERDNLWEWWMFLSVAYICNDDIPSAKKSFEEIFAHLEPGGVIRADVNQCALYLLEHYLTYGVFCRDSLPLDEIEKCARASLEWVSRYGRDPAMQRFFTALMDAVEAQKTGDVDRQIARLEEMVALMEDPAASRNIRLGHLVDVVAADGFTCAQWLILGDLYRKKGMKEKAREAYRRAGRYPAGELVAPRRLKGL